MELANFASYKFLNYRVVLNLLESKWFILMELTNMT